MAAKAGFQVASFDINKRVPKNKRRSSRRKHHFDKRQPFDINGEIGFTYLICALILFDFFFTTALSQACNFANGVWGDCFKCHEQSTFPQSNHHLIDPPSPLPRLCVALCLQAGMGLVMILATVCSTWVAVNLGTSCRSCLVPQGSVTATANRRGNKMVCRTGLKRFSHGELAKS